MDVLNKWLETENLFSKPDDDYKTFGFKINLEKLELDYSFKQ